MRSVHGCTVRVPPNPQAALLRKLSSRPAWTPTRRWALRLGAPAALACLLVAPALGQGLELKRALGPDIVAEQCTMIGSPPLVSPAAAATVDSLLAAGSRAAILEDHYTAGELLRQAAALDPANPVIAYRLARTYEERGEVELAVREYCRYMRVAVQPPDSSAVQERIRSLVETAAETDGEELAAAVRAGLAAYDQRRYEAAALAFSRAIAIRPVWPAPYFNRAVARAALRQPSEAALDLERYLELLPAAEDRPLVLVHITSLRSEPILPVNPSPPPAGVFARGLAIPGLGQQATGRPMAGLLVLTASATAAYWGLRVEEVVTRTTAVDPFGNPYQVEKRSLERTHLVEGIGLAAAAAFAGAVEAYLFARRLDREFQAVEMSARIAKPSELQLHVSRAEGWGALELGFRIFPPAP